MDLAASVATSDDAVGGCQWVCVGKWLIKSILINHGGQLTDSSHITNWL